MAEPIKSALFVDYENLHRSLTGGDGRADTRLADRAAAWVAAIETGRLIGPDGFRRKFVAKRCYAGPSVRGKQRDALASAGFEVIDVGANDGARSSADLHMAMDTIDALGKPSGPEEFILLSGASELTPLLTRLKASKRNTVIFASEAVPDADKALADAFLDRTAFAAFLNSDENPAVAPKSNGAAATDRADIEAFARKIHAATNIPLFSPKTFAELFRHLTDEINQNGYHFQTTAKNVADRMTANGRNVTRRQVVFIVKGLALKGHVFSTTDTAERLAEVFREQAAYLISNAGIALDEKQDRLLSAWFMSKPAVPPAPAAEAEKAQPPPAEPPRRQPVAEQPEVQQPRPPEKAKPAPAAKPTASAKPPPVRPVDLPKSAAPPPPPAAKPIPQPDAREEAKAVIAARIAASAKMKPGNNRPPQAPAKAAPKPAAAKPAAPSPAPPPAPAPPIQARPLPSAMTPRGPQNSVQQPSPDGLENSILAAIAEAVDVLVDGSAETDEQPRETPAARAKPTATTRLPEPAQQSDPDDAESGDIGDQIQRIIASYNRNRSEE